jgi:DNA (cytosine-5)-methyltransferase 1
MGNVMKHGSLEAGGGGFDVAAEMKGWDNIFHVEINPFCRQILNYYWPYAKSYSDIFLSDGKPFRGQIDVLTCGFPCQPFSTAGKGKGDKDNRFIWPENMRIKACCVTPFNCNKSIEQ